MNLTTKYEMGEFMWFIDSRTHKANKAPISRIAVSVDYRTGSSRLIPPYQTTIYYEVNYETFKESEIGEKIFTSKEELLASL